MSDKNIAAAERMAKTLGCDFVRRDTPTTDRDELVEEVIAAVLQDVCELPDRSSPGDQPDMLSVTVGELSEICRTHLTGRIQSDAVTIERMRPIVEWVAARPTIAESMERDWPMADMTPEQRVEQMGQNKRDHDAKVIEARAILTGSGCER